MCFCVDTGDLEVIGFNNLVSFQDLEEHSAHTCRHTCAQRSGQAFQPSSCPAAPHPQGWSLALLSCAAEQSSGYQDVPLPPAGVSAYKEEVCVELREGFLPTAAPGLVETL